MPRIIQNQQEEHQQEQTKTFICFLGDASHNDKIRQMIAKVAYEIVKDEYKFICIDYDFDTGEKQINIYYDTMERFVTKLGQAFKLTHYKLVIENDVLSLQYFDDDVEYLIKINYDDMRKAVQILLDYYLGIYTKSEYMLGTIWRKFYNSEAELEGKEAMQEAVQDAVTNSEDILNELIGADILFVSGDAVLLHERLNKN